MEKKSELVAVNAMSDLHGSLEWLRPEGADVVIIAGDIAGTYRGVTRKQTIIDQKRFVEGVFADLMRSYPDTEFVFTCGNHDFWGSASLRLPGNAHLLIDSGVVVRGLRIWGTPWIPQMDGYWAYEATSRALVNKFSKIPNGLDILITHTPPKVDGSKIDVPLDFGNESPALGSVELTKAIERSQPRFVFCGHIHSGSHGCTEIGGSKCFNVSLVNERYGFAYSPWEDEIETEK